MDEITRLEVELDSVLRELLNQDPHAIPRILARLKAACQPVVDKVQALAS